MEEGDSRRVAELLDAVEKAFASEWQRDALLNGVESAARKAPLPLAREPAALRKLARSDKAHLREIAFRLEAFFTWPGAAPLAGSPDVAPLPREQQRLVEAGREPFLQLCAQCHQPHGGGNPSVTPPLAGSDWVNGPPERLVRVVLHGLYGPIE